MPHRCRGPIYDPLSKSRLTMVLRMQESNRSTVSATCGGISICGAAILSPSTIRCPVIPTRL